MDIDIGSEVVIKVKMGDKTHQLREPLFEDVDKLNAEVKKTPEDNQILCFRDFIIDLGFPATEAKKLGIFRLRKLVDGLVGAFKEKK